MIYKGSCHCGAIEVEAEGQLEQAFECNCSHCSRKGYLLWFLPREQVKFTAQEGKFGIYRFNQHVIEHHFCLRCGCAPVAFGKLRSGADRAVVNVRCLQGVEPATLQITQVDGRKF